MGNWYPFLVCDTQGWQIMGNSCSNAGQFCCRIVAILPDSLKEVGTSGERLAKWGPCHVCLTMGVGKLTTSKKERNEELVYMERNTMVIVLRMWLMTKAEGEPPRYIVQCLTDELMSNEKLNRLSTLLLSLSLFSIYSGILSKNSCNCSSIMHPPGCKWCVLKG